jgi:hypothetical protein
MRYDRGGDDTMKRAIPLAAPTLALAAPSFGQSAQPLVGENPVKVSDHVWALTCSEGKMPRTRSCSRPTMQDDSSALSSGPNMRIGPNMNVGGFVQRIYAEGS